jgi:15-cis-phytoene synthase
MSTPTDNMTIAGGEYSLQQSHDYCRKLAKRAARNFYFSFLTLPAEHYRAMCALYAFMRHCDDIGDECSIPVEQRREALRLWREDVVSALDGGEPAHIILPAMCEVVSQFEIPREYLLAAIDGVGMDLHTVEFATFAELSDYCYHVAGVVGLCCIEIWDYHDECARAAAIDCGLALQLTNILRDLKEDAEMDRVYLPQEDLQRFDYTIEDIRAERRDDRFHELMKFQVARARDYYTRGQRLFEYLDPRGRPILDAMLGIYGGLLDEIERRDYDVYSNRARLSTPRKLAIAGSAVLRHRWRRLVGR